MKSPASSAYFYAAALAALFSLAVIVLGSYTRLVDAGLGCPDWPSCYGHLWVPETAEEIAIANERFEATPVETDKTWPEQLHRLLATSLGVFILVVFALAFRSNRSALGHVPWKSTAALLGLFFFATFLRIFSGDMLDPLLLILAVLYFANLLRVSLLKSQPRPAPFLQAALVTGLVILQGLFGMWTVTLYLWPQVVTAHLLGGFTIFSLLWLLVARIGGWQWSLSSVELSKLQALRLPVVVALVLVVLQIALGGWVASNYAALACPDLPQCQGQWLPPTDYSEGFNLMQKVGPNYLGGQMDNDARVAIHLTHRIGAIIVTIVLAWLSLKCWLTGARPVRRMTLAMLAVLAVQLLLGLSNIIFFLPLWVAVAHNLVGALLMGLMVQFVHRIYSPKAVPVCN